MATGTSTRDSSAINSSMDMGPTPGPTAILTLEIGSMTNRMVMGSTNLPMGPGTRDNSGKANSMVKECSEIRPSRKMTLLSMWGFGLILSRMARGKLSTKMGISTMVSFKEVRGLVLECMSSIGTSGMKEIGGTMPSMELANFIETINSFLKGGSKMDSNMALESTSMKMEIFLTAISSEMKGEDMEATISHKEGSWNQNSTLFLPKYQS